MLNLKAYRPKPKMSVSDWVLENIVVPSQNARPGPISFRDAPYQREVLDACGDRRYSRVTFKSGAQVGKTLISLGRARILHDTTPDVTNRDAKQSR